MSNTYVSGALVRVATYSGTIIAPVGGFRDINNNLINPTVVTLKYKPGNNAATVTIVYPDARIVQDATGLFHSDLDTTGATAPLVEWIYEWIGTGVCQASAIATFEVTPGL
jgi:hypothetical protein